MKKITLLFISFSILLLSSCSENEESLDFSNIIGTWAMVNYDYSGTSETSFSGETVKSTFTGEAFDLDNSITFSENPNAITSTGSFSLRLTTTTLGETVVTTQTGLRAVEGVTWKIEEDELISSINGVSNSSKILELTDSKLVLYSETEQTTGSSSFSNKFSVEARITFERQ